ncbi:hypothetical protein SAMN04488009_2598 [Maribacter sedimenticola]|uniref:Uncharacterized protein n=1 Tax=Maribacter sedimenticola TaxID=228956 RepID=A0ABY1SIH4_9FLAO|nr:hypothetical protein [Maribacter sedimenticola]SNR58007.1 hypothetical protein SAMN04488009_2598 [Maribacter sedimenticola]
MSFKLFVSLFLLAFLYNCKIDDGLDCTVIDCATEQLFSIEFLDEEGTNLITNETYKLDTIEITTDGTSLELIPLDSTKLVTFIIVGAIGETSYSIKLNPNETDTLVLTTVEPTTNINQCCTALPIIEKVSYNQKQKNIIQMDNGFEKISVIK